MLTCITCSKQRAEDGEDEAHRENPNTKDAIKSLTTQIKDMALKVSGSNKGGIKHAEPNLRNVSRYPDFDKIISDEGTVPYPFGQHGSSSSIPVWHYASTVKGTPRPDSGFGRESMLEDEGEAKEWTAQVEPGVQITFVTLPTGGNDLKRIRFSREMFNKWQAQRWWGENYDRIMELYTVQKFNQQAFNTPGRSEDGRDSVYSRLGSARESPRMTPAYYRPTGPNYFPQEHSNHQHYGVGSGGWPTKGGEMSSMEASRTTTSSRDDAASVSVSNASEVDAEWIEEDEPSVFITIRQLVDGTRELRRVRFSRERFGELHAKQWWETNRERIQAQYHLS